MILKHLSTTLCITSAVTSLVTAWQVRRATHGTNYSPIVETRTEVVNAQEPILRAFTIEHITSYTGDKVGDAYVKTVRGHSYVVTEDVGGNRPRYMLYSPLLGDLKVGTKLRGWFAILPFTGGYGSDTYPFVAPLELEPIVTNTLP